MNAIHNGVGELILEPIISYAGCGALLIDSAEGEFNPVLQRHIWAVARDLEQDIDVKGVVTGVNNILVMFDPLVSSASSMERHLRQRWMNPKQGTLPSSCVEIPVVYGGAAGEDLTMLAQAAGLSIADWVTLHSEAVYEVACIGSMPGFAYLTGLPAMLAHPRRSTPRNRLEKGSVIIGASQAGVMPCTAPSGWHVVGRTDVEMFNVLLTQPCLLEPGDTVRFVAKEVLP